MRKKKRFCIRRTELITRVWYVAAFDRDEAALKDYLDYEPVSTEIHWGSESAITVTEKEESE